MTLREKQSIFAVLFARLIVKADARGYAVTYGEGYRSPEEAARLAKAGKGIATSLHTLRLAHDLNLFVDGQYQRSSAAYRELGDWWEACSTAEYACCWGGNFKGGLVDGNHFSIGHGGRK